MIENILLGRHIAKSSVLKEMAAKIIDQLGGVIARGIFRRHLEPVEAHAIISSLCFFAIESRPTFAQFGYDNPVGLQAVRNRIRRSPTATKAINCGGRPRPVV